MKRLLFIFTLLLCWNAAYALTNLTFVKQELTNYYDSGAYFTEIENVVRPAKENLIEQAEHNLQHEKLAIVLDIDDTAISNYPNLKSVDFGGDHAMRIKIALKGDAPAIPAVLALYNLALKENVDVFFVTGRPNDLQEITEKMLKNDGYTKWTGIYFQTPEYKNIPISNFKTAMRKKITDMGCKIIENVGDQYSDLKGGYALQQYKIPNPFYYIP
ncbi:MAG TPA: HAD family acid phosphatase [Bacteroidia bacterium]|nr:HAD family acid phosphatase [Bacteroidia bacterium]